MRLARQQYRKMPLADLQPHPRNPRRGDLAAISESLERNDFYGTIVVQKSTNYVLAGNHRLLAAREAGADDLPAMVIDCDDETALRILLADNGTSDRAEYDDPELHALLKEIGAKGGTLEGTGFGLDDFRALEREIARLERPVAAPPTPAPPAEPRSQRGEVYDLGRHRLMCGDATNADDIAELLGAARPALVFTSPPYAVGADYGTYADTIDNLRALLTGLAEAWADVVPSGGYCVVNFGDVIAGSEIAGADEPCEYPMALEHWPAFRHAGWILHSRRVWAKPHARVAAPWTASSNRAASDWEHVWTWKRPGPGLNERRDPSYLGVWDTSRGESVDVGKDTHPAAFPVLLPRWVLSVYSDPDDAVADPFAGTGTTLFAAEQMGRSALLMEIDPAYCDVIRDRYEAFVASRAAA